MKLGPGEGAKFHPPGLRGLVSNPVCPNWLQSLSQHLSPFLAPRLTSPPFLLPLPLLLYISTNPQPIWLTTLIHGSKSDANPYQISSVLADIQSVDPIPRLRWISLVLKPAECLQHADFPSFSSEEEECSLVSLGNKTLALWFDAC